MLTMTSAYHNPVLLSESVDGLAIKNDGVYVDVTFGGGGHSREILKRLGEDGKSPIRFIKLMGRNPKVCQYSINFPNAIEL